MKRLQQGFYEGLASQNRRLGNAASTSANASASGYVAGIGSASWLTVVTATVLVAGAAQDLLVWSYVNFNRTSGTLGDTFFAEIVKDTDPDNSTLAFPTDASFQSAGVPNDALSRTFTLIARYQAIQPGQHTIKVRCTTTGDTFQAIATVNVIAV
jgi:hypothetical protein